MSTQSVDYTFQGTPSQTNPLYGLNPIHGKCLGFFTEYQKCYIQADIPEKECRLWQEDYAECKMRVKEKSRIKAIAMEREKQLKLQKQSS
ncbi:hypothetical protein MIR68_010138 [Amoeboaphelidium protococcarum]|nr:hypothetical protein MIR68_010138 [Amoeboaphelidium protococcarum]